MKPIIAVVIDDPASYTDIASDGGLDPRNRPGGYEEQRRNEKEHEHCISCCEEDHFPCCIDGCPTGREDD